jgi:hypothetical protein
MRQTTSGTATAMGASTASIFKVQKEEIRSLSVTLSKKQERRKV